MTKDEYNTVLDFLYRDYTYKSDGLYNYLQATDHLCRLALSQPTPQVCRILFYSIVNVLESTLQYGEASRTAIQAEWYELNESDFVQDLEVLVLLITHIIQASNTSDIPRWQGCLNKFPRRAALMAQHIYKLANEI